MIKHDDYWLWDSWYAPDGAVLHAYFLMAPKSLGDPDLRHVNATVGHATSTDGQSWHFEGESFAPSSDPKRFDSQAIWTGSVVHHNGQWHYFFTGIDQRTRGRVQRIGHAVGHDLQHWNRVGTEPILRATSPHYQTAITNSGDEPFRDPWVFSYQGAWHLLATANDPAGFGTIAHATSTDLMTWHLHAPLTQDTGFRQLEVVQTLEVDGRYVLVFCMQPRDIERPGVPKSFATYSAPAEGPLGPFNLDRAEPIADGIYAGRVITLSGRPHLMGFIDSGEPGGFTGTICDPIALDLTTNGTLRAKPSR